MATPTLRPLSTPELLDRTFSLYRSRFLLFVGIISIPNVLTLAVNLLRIALYPMAFSVQNVLAMAPAYFAWSLVSVVVTLGVLAASMGGTAVAVSHVYFERPITVAGALSGVLPRVPRLVMLMLVIGLGVGMPVVVTVLAGLWFVRVGAFALALLMLLATFGAIVLSVVLSLAWALAIPAATVEDRRLFAALTRSAQLTRGDRLRVLLVMFVFALIVWVVQLLLTLPVGIMTFMYSMASGGTTGLIPPWLQVLNVVSALVAQCVVGPLMTIGAVVLYYDNRVRKEAFDLELMMAAVDGPTPSA